MRHIYPLNTRHVFITLMLFVALAVGFLLLFPGGFAQAQGTGAITYQENDTGAVSTFAATDPEGGTIYWSLLTEVPAINVEVDGAELIAADFQDNEQFSISADGVLAFNVPPDHETPDDTDDNNVYNIVVVASDDAPGAGTTDNLTQMGYMKVVVTVTDVDEQGKVTLPSLQPQVGVPLTAVLTDPEVPLLNPLDDVTWKWDKSQDMSSWAAIAGGSAASYTPDATTTGYYLRVTATYKDANDSDRTAQVVSANMVRVAPTSQDATAAFPASARTIAENSPAGTNVGDPVTANDTADEVLTYSLTTNTGGFEIDSATGQITVGPRTVLDADAVDGGTQTVEVTATEAGGRSTATATVTITVRNVNEAPMVTQGVTMRMHPENTVATEVVSTYTATDPEGTQDNPITLSLQGADADNFRIAANGELTFKAEPNYEAPADAGTDNVYNITVVVTDAGVNGRNKMTAMREVTIMVANVEEDGTVALSAQQPRVGVPLTASVTDPDGDVTDVTWEWERDNDRVDADDNAAAAEEVIAGATSATYTPTTDDIDSFLRAIATYTDGYGIDTTPLTSVAAVEPRTDNSPSFPRMETGRRSIDEGMTGEVGAPVQASDTEMTQILTYSLSGADAGSFTIIQDDLATTGINEGGQLAVKAGTKLDYEAKSTYMVTVTATDPDSLSGSIDVTITVNDVNEMPEVTGNAAIDYAENGTGSVATFRATDPEGRMIHWSLLATPGAAVVDGVQVVQGDLADSGDFSISAAGVLTFNISPDYETRGDDDTNNVYSIVLVASDDAPGAGGTMGYKKVAVTVTDVAERGMVSLTSLQPQVAVALTASLTDPEVTDDQITAATWKWEQSRSRTSGWTAISGGNENDAHAGRYDQQLLPTGDGDI